MSETVSLMEAALVTLGVMWTVFAYFLGRTVGATRAYREARDLLQEAWDYGLKHSQRPAARDEQIVIRNVLDTLERRSE